MTNYDKPNRENVMLTNNNQSLSTPEVHRAIADMYEEYGDGWYRCFECKLTLSDEWVIPTSRINFYSFFLDGSEIRLKKMTKTITIEVPEVMKERPKYLDMYYHISTHGGRDYVGAIRWEGDHVDERLFSIGIWDSREKAQQAAQAFFGALKD